MPTPTIDKLVSLKKAFDELAKSEELKQELWSLVCSYMDWQKDSADRMTVLTSMGLALEVWPKNDAQARYFFEFKRTDFGVKVVLNFREEMKHCCY